MTHCNGCHGQYSKEKSADTFRDTYEGKFWTVRGVVETVGKGSIELKVLPDTFTYDLSVKLLDPNSAYNIEKGQLVTARFIMKRAGGCILPYNGDHGVIG